MYKQRCPEFVEERVEQALIDIQFASKILQSSKHAWYAQR